MTTVTTTSPSITTRAAIGIGVLSGVVAMTLATLFAHDWREVAVVAAVLTVATAAVFGFVVPRALRKESAGGTALGLAIPAALLSVPAFWSGLLLVLGVASLLVGNAGRRAGRGSGLCIAALVIAALTVAFYASIYVMEGLAGQTGFLLD